MLKEELTLRKKMNWIHTDLFLVWIWFECDLKVHVLEKLGLQCACVEVVETLRGGAQWK